MKTARMMFVVMLVMGAMLLWGSVAQADTVTLADARVNFDNGTNPGDPASGMVDTFGTGTWSYLLAPSTVLTWRLGATTWGYGHADGNDAQITGFTGLLGNEVYFHPGSTTDTIARWTVGAGEAGQIDITGSIRKCDDVSGDGVNFYIKINGGSPIYSQYVLGSDQTGYTFNLTRTVSVGDTVDFVLNRNGAYIHDSSAFSALITQPLSKNWDNTDVGGGNWATAANWDPDGTMDDFTRAAVGNGHAANVTTAGQQANSVAISGNSTVNVSGVGVLAVTNGVSVANGSSLNVSGTGGLTAATVSSAGTTILGGDITAVSILDVTAGSTTVNGGSIGTLQATGGMTAVNTAANSITILNISGAQTNVHALGTALAGTVNVASDAGTSALFLDGSVNATVGSLTISGGTVNTGTHQITGLSSLTLTDDRNFTATGGTFGVSGSNVRTGRTLYLSGGTVTASNLVLPTSYIPGITATASTVYSADTPAADAVNNNGMDGDLHNTNYKDMWYSGSTASGQWFYVNLGMSYNLAQMKLWNFNETTTGGVRQADLYYTTVNPGLDPGVTFDPSKWTPLAGYQDYEFAKAPGSPGGSADLAATTTIDLTGITAQWFAIKVDSNWGRTTPSGVGISEVRFYAAVVAPTLADTDLFVSADTTLTETGAAAAVTARDLIFGDLDATLTLSSGPSSMAFTGFSLDSGIVLDPGDVGALTLLTYPSSGFVTSLGDITSSLDSFVASRPGWHYTLNDWQQSSSLIMTLTYTGDGSAIPEPAGLGLIGLVLLALRKKRAA